MALLCSAALGNDDADPRDPFESWNRKIFAFNDVADRYVLKPVAKGYQYVTPNGVEQSIGNFFNNIGEVQSMGNDVLQGKPRNAMVDVARFIINSTVGVLGLFDVAGHIGLPREPEDFGQTLAVWGVGSGPYLVLPLFGPSTLRDGTGLAVDSFTSVEGAIDPERARYYMKGLDIVDTRASLLSSEELISGDRYGFLRDAYLQRRQFLINDGEMEDSFGGEDFESFEEF
ncbi:VacJ family lipoprotein [Spongiibacter taiwanensis]|uniref:MlaA family lipoprotein n=1 Tax=Spongiibacter taiwanensis TaxID=1748242 RepID=UPI00203523D0|nr:VacJ family lipoprotein [Spongiibacter taiwanensis]USA43570.1 VacJ family lipoprotein [Spongiibacter taiwanensis]